MEAMETDRHTGAALVRAINSRTRRHGTGGTNRRARAQRLTCPRAPTSKSLVSRVTFFIRSLTITARSALMHGGAAHAAMVNALRASGVIVRVRPEDFLALLSPCRGATRRRGPGRPVEEELSVSDELQGPRL